MSDGAHATLCTVSPYRTSKLFSRNKSNTTMIGFMVVLIASLQHEHRKKRSAESFSLREKTGYVGARLDGRLHTDTPPLHAKTLAALGATSCQDGTTTLSGHTSTETVGLGALALIRLISALHIDSLSR